MSKPVIPVTTTVCQLDCQQPFKALAQQQALYAYHFARASWNGAKICFFERSYESPAIIYLVLKGFAKGSKQTIELAKKQIDDLSINQILVYIAAVIDNAGNYKSFGDSKFVPQCTQQIFKKFWLLTPYWSQNKQQFEKIYSNIQKLIFNAEQPYHLINFSDKKGTSGYYSKNVTTQDAEKIKQILINKGIKSQNNRLTKQCENQFTVKIAAVQHKEEIHQENGIKIKFVYGQFSSFLQLVNNHLQVAAKHSANQNQRKMIQEYIKHFNTGDMQNHLQSQRHWIKDKGPIIQTNIGFIQSYLDPLKIRAQFQGFVAVVNQQQSKLLNKLVEGAPTILTYLPWGAQFQVQQFKKPDFTSLQVLAFGSSGIPVGINIPNYDQIRQNLGFKNVNLSNAYGKPTKQSLSYIPQQQKQLHLKYSNSSLFVIVALHQLLGHGSGRLYDQKPNFLSPLDGQQFTTYYKQNQTWHSVFGQIASTYQQCKADSVALYLSLFEDVQQILLPNYTKQQRWETVYVCWFHELIGGVKGLQYFDVNHKKWLQAHVGSSYAILSVLRRAGGIFQIKQIKDVNGNAALQICMNKENFKTKGKEAIGNFLKHLQIYKSTADFQRGSKYFQQFLQVDQQLLKYRQTVIKNKKPRRLTVQPDVTLVDGKTTYIKFENNPLGMIDSALSHFSQNVQDIINQWWKNNQEFAY